MNLINIKLKNGLIIGCKDSNIPKFWSLSTQKIMLTILDCSIVMENSLVMSSKEFIINVDAIERIWLSYEGINEFDILYVVSNKKKVNKKW